MTARPTAAAATMPEPQPRTDQTPGQAPAPTPSTGRRRPKLVDWRRAARLLADGSTPEEIAAAVGIDDAHFWRHLRNSLRFQFYIRQARERRRLLGRMELERVAGEAVLRCLRNAAVLDPDSLHWTAGQAGFAAEEATSRDDDLIAQLAATGRLKRRPQPAEATEPAAAEPTVETKRNEAPRATASPPPAVSPLPVAATAPPWGGMGAPNRPPSDLPGRLAVRHFG